jgi:hypothetical protein
VLRQSTNINGNPVVSFWVPTDANGNRYWHASSGQKVWRISNDESATIAESVVGADLAQPEEIISLSGVHDVTGETLFACTGQHLFRSPDGSRWNMVHDFGEDRAIALAVTPSYLTDRAIYALLLGGTFCQGIVSNISV